MNTELISESDGTAHGQSQDDMVGRLHGLVERAVDAFVSPRLPEFPSGLAELVGSERERRFRRQLPSVLSMVLRAQLETFSRQDGGAGESSRVSEHGASGLALVDDRAIERRIAYGNVVRKVDAQGDRGLWMLNARLAHVIGIAGLDDEVSPFRAQLFVEALGRAWQAVDPDGDHEMTVVRTYGRELVGRISAVYPRLNDWLDERKIAVEIAARFVVQRSRDQGSRANQDAGLADASPAVRDRPLNRGSDNARLSGSQELQAALSAFFADAPGHAQSGGMEWSGDHAVRLLDALPGPGHVVEPAAPEAVRAVRARMLDDHPELEQTFVEAERAGFELPTDLHRISEALDGQDVSAQEKRMLQLLTELFSSLYSDDNLPVTVKARIGELQLAVLRSTLHDQSLLFDRNHPLRRLINGIASAGACLQAADGLDDPLVQKISEIVDRARDSAGDDPAVFGALDAELRQFIAAEEAAAEKRVAEDAPVQGTELQAADARLAADGIILDRLESRAVPGFMADMLRAHWAEVMAIAHLRMSTEPGAWRDAERLLDQLLWSVEPKRAGGDRQKLIKVLPKLLAALSSAFNGIMWRDDSRNQFMGRLAHTHASLVGGKPDPVVPASPGSAASRADEPGTAGEMSAELSPLQRGLLFDLRLPDGSRGRYRLSWVSPMRTRFVFTNREGREAQTCSASELIDMFAGREIRLVDRDSAFERALIAALKAATRQKRATPAA